jgi:hypothetical protein
MAVPENLPQVFFRTTAVFHEEEIPDKEDAADSP